MRNLILVTLIGLIAGVPVALGQMPPKVDTPEYFRDLTQRRADAHVAGDRAFYEKLLSTDFVLMGDNGAVTKKNEYLDIEFAGKRGEGMKPFFSISDFRVIALRKDLAEQTTDQPATVLMPLGFDTFFDPEDSPAARTIFRRDASGKVVAWSYVNGDQEVVARKSN